MPKKLAKQRVYASLLCLGACILIFRTLRMMFFEDAFDLLVEWVIALLIIEFLIDLSCLAGAIRWWIAADEVKATLPLRLGAAAAIFHALRVLVYVLGRTGPWENFDVKPEQQATYTFEWFWVYFAAILSVLGIVGVIVIWRFRIHARKQNTH
ncbi:MAG: hypothetical protein GY845_37750 [Planctomycetes bacterium]|nr:hypothetical protein [Planctomycetota bacterium]